MKIAVVGAGAMGSLFGGRLAEAGQEVWLIEVWKAHVDAIRAGGLAFSERGTTRQISIKATTEPAEAGAVDLVIVFCKHNNTREAIRGAAPLIVPETLVLTLQNGIGNVDIIRSVVPADQVVMGLTTLAAILRGPGHVEVSFLGRGETYIWPVSGKVTPPVERVASTMTAAGIDTEISAHVELRVWRKLIVNAGVTALSAVVPLSIGDIADHPNARDILEATTREVVAVAQKKGIPLTYEEGIEYLWRVSAAAKAHVGSMTVDVTHGKKTEIEAINGAVVREGERLGVPTPVNRFVYDVIRIIEDTYDRRITGGEGR